MTSADALVSLAALEVACDEGVVPHLARLDEALGRATGADRAIIGCVREVLGVHLELLRRRPDALWPVLWARAAFVDSPAARALNPGGSFGPELTLHQRAHEWLEDYRALHPNRPWLRALVPTTPREGLVAELRLLDRATVHAVSAEAVHLEREQRHWRWDVRTGTVSPLERPAVASALVTPPGGGLAVKRGAQLDWLLDPAWHVSVVSESADGRRAACHAEDLDEAVVLVFDLASGRQLASLTPSSTAVALSPTGAQVAFGRRGVTVVHELSSGRERVVARWGSVSSLAVDDAGEWLAQVEDGVTRVCRPAATARPTPLTEAFGPGFSSDGSVAVLGGFLLSGLDGTVLARHEHRRRTYLEGGPAPNGVRVTAERLCVSEAFFTETIDVHSGEARRLPLEANLAHRVAWSGDGRVFARVRRGESTIELATAERQWTVEAGRPLADLALDHTGSQLALLHGDGTVQLQAGGTRLRQLPGATSVAFLANDRAIAVGGAATTVVLGLDGSERWRSSDRFSASDRRCAEVEWQSGLRAPSLAESLRPTLADGLLTVRLGDREAVFPASRAELVPSPRHGVFFAGAALLRWEPEAPG